MAQQQQQRDVFRLDGRSALITGAGSGLGEAIARAFAAAGAAVLVTDVDKDAAVATAESISAAGGTAQPFVLDVRDSARVGAAVEQILEEMGSLEIVVANAGIVSTGPLEEVSDQVWQQLVDTNLTGVFHTLRAAIPVMRRQRFGRIVVTSSMGGRMGIPELAPYNATKWGVIGLAKSVALEVAREGITVNVICPTTVQTPMVQPAGSDGVPDDLVRRMMKANPIPQPWLQPEDVSRGLLYLVTDPGVITGSVLEIGLGGSARIH